MCTQSIAGCNAWKAPLVSTARCSPPYYRTIILIDGNQATTATATATQRRSTRDDLRSQQYPASKSEYLQSTGYYTLVELIFCLSLLVQTRLTKDIVPPFVISN